ncbi:MAG: family 78 glycoside hydrolase catalytic domain [Phycisphaerae bacterium]
MMKLNLGTRLAWIALAGGCITLLASHAAGAASTGFPRATREIPAADQVQPALPSHFAHASADAPFRLRCNWARSPLGVQQRHPRLTWMPPQQDKLRDQASYQIQVAQSRQAILQGNTLVWDSGKVPTSADFLPQYQGPALKPFMHYYWRVRIWSRSGWQSRWSPVASWMTGPLNAEDWRGDWISYYPHIINPFYKMPHNAYYGLAQPKRITHKSWVQKQPCPIFRKVFRAPKHLSHAYMYIAGLGYWKVLVNGRKAGPGVLCSTLYDYSKTVPFQSFDVTHLLRKGHRNVVTISLGNGWYNIMEATVFKWQNAVWKAWPRTRMALLMRSSDGKARWLGTDTSWQAAPGPRLADAVFNGEVYDASLKIHGWNNPKRALASMPHAQRVRPPAGRLTSQLMPPCEVMHRFAPTSITEPKPHVFVITFPQNMSGWVTLTAAGRPGVPVVLRYGEQLDANGLVSRKSISYFAFTGPFQTDTIIPADSKPFTYHPNFSYSGFRYVQINGLSSKKDILKIEADYIHTAFHRASTFWCANPLVNAIADATNHSYCSNFMGYPTDCPTREKNGYGADAWVASAQGMMTYNNQAGYAKWLDDIQDTQYANGALMVVMPNPSGWDWEHGRYPDPDWESCYEFICWNQFLYYGDGRVLRKHYDGLKRYFQFVLSYTSDYILPGNAGIGDWSSASRHVPPVDFTSTCLLYHNAVLLSRIATILHHPGDAAIFEANAAAIRKAFNQKFYKGDGVYDNGGQTAEAMPLYYRIATAAMRPLVLRQLVQEVHTHHDHLDVGLLGDKCLFRVLSRYGYTALAYRIATQTTRPSYGQWILLGATTLWEEWGLCPYSLNHIMFGDILGWMYSDLAGINPDWQSPGFRTILIKPRPVRALPWAGAEHESPFGLIKSAWRWRGKQLDLNIAIPAATSAFITLAGAGHAAVQCNGKPLAAGTSGVLSIKSQAGAGAAIVIHTGPGRYRLVYTPQGLLQ